MVRTGVLLCSASTPPSTLRMGQPLTQQNTRKIALPPQKGLFNPLEQGAEEDAGAVRKTAAQRMDKPAHHATRELLPKDRKYGDSPYLEEKRPLRSVQCRYSGFRFDEEVFALLDLLHGKRKKNMHLLIQAHWVAIIAINPH